MISDERLKEILSKNKPNEPAYFPYSNEIVAMVKELIASREKIALLEHLVKGYDDFVKTDRAREGGDV